MVDILIIGQGICGTMLSWYFEKAGLSFIMIDESKPNSASRAAAGIINPVTGRRIVKTWMIDELMPFAWDAYRSIEKEYNIPIISKRKIIDFFSSPQMLLAFRKRYEEDQQYLNFADEEKKWDNHFRYDFGWGEISPCYLIDVQNLLDAHRKKLIERGLLIDEHFEISELKLKENEILYRDIKANAVIFCDGISGFDNPYFKNLPFAPNKGEALIIETDMPSENYIFKKGINMVPLKDNIFWVGSSYEWEFEHDQPTTIFRERTEALLNRWLKNSFKTLAHFAAVRPATLERRPFAGFHPVYKNIGLLNGMGTKGCSLAPFFAKQLVELYTKNIPVNGDADVKRFSRILMR